MPLTERLAVNIGRKAKLILGVDEDEEQIIIYGAISLLQTIFAILWVIIIGLFLGVLYEALIFSVAVGILRKYSGGAHASSPSRCIIIGTALAAAAGIAIDKLFYKLPMSTVAVINIFFIIISFIIVFKNAPVDSIKKPITNMEMKKRFKRISMFVIFVFFLIIIILFKFYIVNPQVYYVKVVESVCLAVLWQSITLTKPGIYTLNKMDFALKNIIEGRKVG